MLLRSVTSPLIRAMAAAVAGLCLTVPLAHAKDDPAPVVTFERLWRHAHVDGGVVGQKSEIVAHDERTDTLWVAGVVGVDVLDRRSGAKLAHIDVQPWGAVNSVAIHDGLAALAIENTSDRAEPGVVLFVDTRSRTISGAPVPVGSLPDMLTFTPDGRRVLVANEATPNARAATDPAGSVSIVDVRQRSVVTLPISASIPGYAALRQFPALGNGTTRPNFTPQDPEPEYIAVDREGHKAYVVLQEANGIAVLDLRKQAFERIFSLGLKDFSLPGNEIDPGDRDGVIALRSVPVFGLYQPDSLATYRHEDRTYLVMANEGDAREDEADERRGGAGSGAAEYESDSSELARLTLSNVDSAKGGPLVKFGAHSMTIRDTDGTVVYDSGRTLDEAAIARGIYDDGRSDNKGVEPEGLALLKIEDRTLAFVGLERATTSAIGVFDITDPRKVRFLDLIVSADDLSPEGLSVFKVKGRHYLAIANEVSDSTSLFRVRIGDRDASDDGKDDGR
ncbi:choice-of-anchor I family protein [Sphaerotilus mobilis]|uniref:Choice-of-anchor I domain-containing protein n=1 Tax=Sphaerotilus mobilis TaxID=47994 RepID=A0A4Q7LEI6_9BURK|nr:choice-of-anchor I family protein [Sphaerotilus mobilis]RZS52363.1 hypothetical protein EV685_3556 [Sphaerotilus mobilis]